MEVKLLSTINNNKHPDTSYRYPGKPITETISNGFFTVDKRWTVKYWNKAAEKLLGVPAPDIVGKNLWEKFAAIIPLNFYTVYHKAFIEDVPLHFKEYWGEMGDWFDVVTYYSNDTLSVSFKSSNRPAHIEYPEQKLKLLNELYKHVTEVTNDCLWEWNLQEKELFWIDGGHKRVFGYPIENALIPQSFWESRIHPDDKERITTKFNGIVAGGTESVWEDEYRFRKAGGDYACVHDRGHIIYEQDKPVRMIGATQDITSRRLLVESLIKERHAKHREITEAVLLAQERERADIGRELHDNVNQILSVAKMYIQVAQTSEKNRKMSLEYSCELLIDAITELRKIAKSLIIPQTHIIGLFDNIKNLLNDLVHVYPVKIEFYENGIDEEKLDEKLQLNIFRIVQEQLNNIIKHANATHAAINLSTDKDNLVLFITDNGVGVDIATERKGVGIRNIITRAELCQGTAEIESEPGKGFQLKVVLPFPGNL
jgi:PAS domain S-box-containing protein